MGCPKNSTIAQRINLSKSVSHKWNNRIVDDRAPTEAENSQKISNILEINTHWIDDQDRWDDSGEEESAWACKKYNGHCTLLPDALWEARAHV